ncbi:hypothetical protein ACLB1O_32515 [Escherichia coli]
MATYHLNVKFGGQGQAGNHADYIERKGEYEKRKDLEYSEHGNMPGWREIIPPISGKRLISLNVRMVRLIGRSKSPCRVN